MPSAPDIASTLNQARQGAEFFSAIAEQSARPDRCLAKYLPYSATFTSVFMGGFAWVLNFFQQRLKDAAL
ncbi:hypothetical protein E0E50_01335 [Azotobacter chroococcum subsp. isscasi]|uniref:hypothetical protein n=1 Tax=Azotobacter chroococcum TaxID=353 RepID=UPI00103F599C|nr:hypothetical protein [Azotobacter chroococcum]TBW12942.1 hypothetical protein E0E50_01335 [Azotobacter chroococcum subsp. isscasi]